MLGRSAVEMGTMTSKYFKVLGTASFLLSTPALAGPLSLWLGQTEMLGLQRKVCRISVTEPSVVTVRKLKTGAELRARKPGVSHIQMITTEGYVFDFDVHVTER